MDRFNIFLHFLTENIDRYINSATDSLSFLESITICIDRADCEKGAKLFYQGSNIKRKTRNYNMEDNRHIETHPNYDSVRKKSPLLGGIGGKPSAKILLKNAVGDKKQTQRLYNFDEDHGCYIQFEYEGDNLQNQYHGYHLVKPLTHEIDKKAVRNISERVIRILKYRLHQN